MSKQAAWAWVGAWAAALVVALILDEPTARAMRQWGVDGYLKEREALRAVLKAPGSYWFSLMVAAGASFTHPLRWRAGGFLLLATLVSGLNWLLKWVAGRTRPFKLDADGQQLAPFELRPFVNGWHGLFNPPNLSFPSGHTCLSFATAAALAMLWPRARWPWIGYGVACVVGLERVAENAHWLSDVVAAAALGVGGAKLVAWALIAWNKHQAKPLTSLS